MEKLIKLTKKQVKNNDLDYCMDCGQRIDDIVDEVFEKGEKVFINGGIWSIEYGKHKINFRDYRVSNGKTLINMDCSGKYRGKLFCENCGEELEEKNVFGYVERNEWCFDGYKCLKCGFEM